MILGGLLTLAGLVWPISAHHIMTVNDNGDGIFAKRDYASTLERVCLDQSSPMP